MILPTARVVQRAFLVGVHVKEDPLSSDLSELEELLRTAHTEVVGGVVQQREAVHPDLYVGTGKLAEIKDLAKEAGANLIVCDDELTPRQERNLEDELGLAVIDRTALILDIFAEHAHSSEGKLQVELAQLEYNMARMRGLWTHLERLGGGVGTRGPGESQIETDRRLARSRISALRTKLGQLAQNRELRSKERDSSTLPKVALVGYTNAGKSTLMNQLCESDVGVRNRLFHTLDPTTRSATVGSAKCLISDTVGFIRKLPHGIVDAFKATLDEARNSDLLLNVVNANASDETLTSIESAVSSVLEEIGAGDKPQVHVFNKIDLLTPERLKSLKAKYPNSEFISAAKAIDLELLAERIEKELRSTTVAIKLLVPYSSAGVVDELHRIGIDVSSESTQDGLRVSARVAREAANRYSRFFSEGESGESRDN